MITIRCKTTKAKFEERAIRFLAQDGSCEKVTAFLAPRCQLQSWMVGDKQTTLIICMLDDSVPSTLASLLDQFGTWEVIPNDTGPQS